MIEVNWIYREENTNDVLTNITQLITWLMVTMKTMKEERKTLMNGFLVVTEKDKGTSALLLSDDIETQKEMINILLSPPPEFKDKFTASILQVEPIPVEEKEKENEEKPS